MPATKAENRRSKNVKTNRCIPDSKLAQKGNPTDIKIIADQLSEIIMKYVQKYPDAHLDTKVKGVFFNRESKEVVLHVNRKHRDFFLTSKDSRKQILQIMQNLRSTLATSL